MSESSDLRGLHHCLTLGLDLAFNSPYLPLDTLSWPCFPTFLSIYIILILLFVLVLVLVMVILLHVDSVLVLVIVSKISLSIAILFYALVYDDDDEDDAGLSSGAGMNFKSGRYMSGAMRRKILCRALHFFGFTSTISRFGKRFRVASTV